MKNIAAFILMMVSACAGLWSGSEPLPVKTELPMFSAGALPLQPNGDFVVSVERQGRWQEVGRHEQRPFLREQRLDLASWLQGAKAGLGAHPPGRAAAPRTSTPCCSAAVSRRR